MSRLADALNKRGLNQSAARARDALAYPADTHVPWDFAGRRPSRRAQVVAVEPPPPVPPGGFRQLHVAHSSVSDQEISQLVDRLFLPEARQGGRRSVVFAPVDSTTGAGTLCAATANALASRTARRVCLIDGNLRAPAIHEPFGVENAEGVSEALMDGRPLHGAVKQLTQSLWILPAGQRGPEALPHLTPGRIRSHLRELRERFDYLLVNTAAATVSPEVFALAAALDGVVLVLEASTTRRETARWALTQLQAAGATVLGAVLTNRTFPVPEQIYRRL